MSRIVSIGTAVPQHCHRQEDILHFMQTIYAATESEQRKLRFLYRQSGIRQRYSVIADYSRSISDWKFYAPTENLEPFPSLEQRMAVYHKQAPLLSVDAIRDCLGHEHEASTITHLITVSCTGMSAPGLDLQVVEMMELNRSVSRTSVNFMGCYAAIHAMKMAHAICGSERHAKVLIVCTELCTLHFQKEATMDNITSSMLFGDGAAAVLITGGEEGGLMLGQFYSEIIPKGKRDMAWELSSSGFLMTLSGYIPDLIEADFSTIVDRALEHQHLSRDAIAHWCIHPGGKRILEAIQKSLAIPEQDLAHSYRILSEFGNLSSATILFVLKEMLREKKRGQFFGAAFGPGLTVETFTASN